jgi:hypothetical protein
MEADFICTECKTDLALGYQSSDNLNLCQNCSDYRKQGAALCDDADCYCRDGD